MSKRGVKTGTIREGCLLVTSDEVRSLKYIIRKLKKCANKYKGCDDCPDLKACVKAYDFRCDMGKKRVVKIREGNTVS